jgi:putative SOS response-associated peptidase YedK
MCAYFEQELAGPDLAHLLAEFGVAPQASANPQPSVRPTDPALVIDRTGLRTARFGLARPSGPLLVNARAETLDQRATFRPLLAEGRCLIPMTSFEETGVQDGRRVRMRFAASRGPLLGVGLLREDRFVLVTCAAGDRWAPLRERMPALLDLEAGRSWLATGALTLAAPELTATPIGSSAGRHPGQAAL